MAEYFNLHDQKITSTLEKEKNSKINNTAELFLHNTQHPSQHYIGELMKTKTPSSPHH